MVLSLLPIAFATAGLAHGWPSTWLAMPVALACLWSPGVGFARWLGSVGVQGQVEAVAISVVLSPISTWVVASTGTGGAGVLAAAFSWWAVGGALAAGARARHPALGEGRVRVGVLAAAMVLAISAFAHRADLGRELDRYVEPPGDPAVLAPGGPAPAPGSGWASFLWIGDPGRGALKLVPREGVTSLVGPTGGPMRVDLFAPVGRRAWVDEQEVIARAPGAVGTNADGVEGGNAEVVFGRELAAGEAIDIVFDDPARSLLFVAASLEASRALDTAGGIGRARAEVTEVRSRGLVSARELLDGNATADAHAWLLAGPAAVGHGDLPAARAAFGVLLVASAGAFACANRRVRGAWSWGVFLGPSAFTLLVLRVAYARAGECFPAFLAAVLLGLAWLGRHVQRSPAYG
jgi:hypothetical protein